MAQYFTDFSGDLIGQLPANTTLRREAGDGDYQVVSEGGVNQLRYYVPAGAQKARGLSFDAIVPAGTVEIFTTVRDVDRANPNTCRALLCGNDSPDSDYEAYLLNAAQKRFSILRRLDGTQDLAASLNPTPLPTGDDYYHMRLRVEEAGYRLYAKYWLEGSSEPEDWIVTIWDSDLPRSGWMGLLGFVVGATVYYKNVGIGTDGDPAPTGPLISENQIITASAIDSTEQFGQSALSAGPGSLLIPSIPSAEAVPGATFAAGDSAIAMNGIDSAEHVGTVHFAPGTASIDALAIDSVSSVSHPEFIAGATAITAIAVDSNEAVGTLSLFNAQQLIRFESLPSDESFGAISVVGGADLAGWLIADIATKAALSATTETLPALTGYAEVNRVH